MAGHRRSAALIGAASFVLIALAIAIWAGAGQAPPRSGGVVWGADYFPNVRLVTHEGRSVQFFGDLIKDKIVVINFIFTSCPDVCPLETARLREVQRILGDRVGRDVFMYSISIDPDRDSPEVLRKYAERFEVGPGWLFLTGQKADITLLRRKLGLLSQKDDVQDLKGHSLNLIIGNQRTGRWMRSSPYENPHVMATQIGSWLDNWKSPPSKDRDYADAPKVRNISQGESLFRTRCASCHTIGEANHATDERRPGPDLLGVVKKRDRAWLARWLAEPDKMLAEKDPLAMSLAAEYDNMPMPNLSLTRAQIEALILHMEEETLRHEKQRDEQDHCEHH